MRYARTLRSLCIPVSLTLLGLTACDKDNEPSAAPEPTAEPAPVEQPAGEEAEAPAMPDEAAEAQAARAQLQAAQGKDVSGTVEFTQVRDGVLVEATITGLQPGEHGFHVHETGDCSAPDFKSAGGHFNPTGAPHAAPTDEAHHYGDLGNIEAGEDGTASVSIVMPELSVEEGAEGSVLGRAIVVHEGKDDLKSQPSGAAGARVACGVITQADDTRTAARPAE